MALINFILNLLGLVLWSNWLSSRFDPLSKSTPASLAGTLKRAKVPGPRRWQFLAGLLALLLARAWLCLQISSIVNWTPKLKLGLIVLSFRGDFPSHMLLFSFLSFGSVLAGFYLWLLLLSIGSGQAPDDNPFQKLVHFHLKRLARLPNLLKLMLPFVLGGLAWLALHPLLARMSIVPGNRSAAQLLGQAAVIGGESYLAWEYLIIGVLLLHLVHSYVHIGNHPAWTFVDAAARKLLRPLRWLPLRAGKVDFLPVLVVAAVVLLAIFLDHPPEKFRLWLYPRLPF